ncbi:zinc finger protein 862-like [Leuresthes tenuis]|uniref:zinc finger protein 862-like n=1 Tax=Leuresthes tenuis TaxID=355514 RepID=UPI003B513AC6
MPCARSALCQCITSRFADVNSRVLKAMRLINFQCWPETDTSADFGDDDVDQVISHFRPLLLTAGVDIDLIPDQWTILKTQLYTAGFSQGTFEPTVNRMLHHECPDSRELFDALLTIPTSTADCETGFGVMKQAKSDWCSSLKGETLADLLKTPDIKDFDPRKAIEIWHGDSVRTRGLHFVRKGKNGTDGGSESEPLSVVKYFHFCILTVTLK